MENQVSVANVLITTLLIELCIVAWGYLRRSMQ